MVRPRPKILLIDLEDKIVDTVAGAGFNARHGSYGAMWRVHKAALFPAMPVAVALPNYGEQDVIFVDLTNPPIWDEPPEDGPVEGQYCFWTESADIVDARPLTMESVKASGDRILSHGGVFVVFADCRYSCRFVQGRSLHGSVRHHPNATSLDNWSFLTMLGSDYLDVRRDHGEDMQSCLSNKDELVTLQRLVAQHLAGSTFSCTLRAQHSNSKELAVNKYGQTVAIAVWGRNDRGRVIVLPNLRDKAGFILSLLRDVLPEIRPNLFPDSEGQSWVHRADYELPEVLRLQGEIRCVEEDARARIADLHSQIEQQRKGDRYLYDLLRATDKALVHSVMMAFETLGFKKVIDVDEEMRSQGKGSQLREDIRIEEGLPVVVIDAKGIGGRPADEDALQAQKHAQMHMYDMKSSDVISLAIINHERHIPPLERDPMPFREEIINTAVPLKLGLLTTWNLFRLLRGFLRHGWKHEHIRSLFYRAGLIDPVPVHYHLVGRVAKTWKGGFGVVVDAQTLAPGDRVAVEGPVDFEEAIVASLKVDDQDVQMAKAGDRLGVRTKTPIPSVKEGTRVFKVVV
jgi:hypothetical protein